MSIAKTLVLSLFVIALSCKEEDVKPIIDPPFVKLNLGPCDSNLSINEADAMKAVQSLGICKTSAGNSDGGLISASYIRANDAEIQVNLQFGIMDKFGKNNIPQEGNQMLVLSSGLARTPSQTGSCGGSACTTFGVGTAPAGFPLAVPGCTVGTDIHDDVGFKLELRVPETATGFSIDHSFFTFDYPELVCKSYNDQFIILVDPAPAGALSGDVAFDAESKPIGVNCSFLQGSNASLLDGTGYDVWGDAASTGWLRTTVPVFGGSKITIRFIIYDVGDIASDCSALIDNFKWLTGTVDLKTSAL
jgi:hypothetical protein